MATHSDNRGKSHVDTNGVEEDCQSSVYNQSIDTCGAISTSSNGADPDDFEKGPQDYFEEDNDDAVGAEKTPLRNRKSLKEHADEQATVWGLDKPQLLVSVTGGAKSFNMGKRLRDTFRHGLMKTTGAWVVTGGTNAGVMKHVGEAVRDSGIASMSKNQVIAIAIASWGCVKNKEALINKESNGLWPAYYCIEKKQRGEESFLDPNHSHFILVDNATQHKFGVEIPFRAKLEKEIAKIKPETGENAASVPHILLVLEGGSGTLETVHQAILNNTPTVVVKSSGRAADILAYAYLNRKEVGNEKDHAGKEHTT
ncbi:TRPM2-like protein [Mya arenaria]|uniref:TRPM2-like protein n=1 Tax=Mya arenaria TaxID=6604 RepID=A0ABY7E8E5_MYAAR|nr:TRPM2-like protein [Mya arenaria]